MEIKGTAVKSILQYVKNNYKDKMEEWLNTLPSKSREIMDAPIYANSWYSLSDAGVATTKSIGRFFFNDVNKGAWECGRYSAEIALTGVYKIFIRLASPTYIISKAGRIFSTYYRPSEILVVNKTANSVTLHITKFPEPDSVIEYRIAGWMEKALELNNCDNLKVNITKSLTKGDAVTEIHITWD